MDRDSGRVTRLLRRWSEGEESAGDQLLPLIYDELHKIAVGQMRSEVRGHTLQPTALVHEAYLRLVGQRRAQWKDRGHFFAIASKVIRRVLVDHARRRIAAKRGGGERCLPLYEIADLALERPESLVELDQALDQLRILDPTKAAVVEYRYFGGLTLAEIAQVLGRSAPTVQRYWRLARAWLYQEMAVGSASRPT